MGADEVNPRSNYNSGRSPIPTSQMAKIRIYELARELGVDNRVVIDRATELGLKGKTSHSHSLESDEADLIRRAILRQAVGVSASVKPQDAPQSKEIIKRRSVVDGEAGNETLVERRRGDVIMRRRHVEPAKPEPVAQVNGKTEGYQGSDVVSGDGAGESPNADQLVSNVISKSSASLGDAKVPRAIMGEENPVVSGEQEAEDLFREAPASVADAISTETRKFEELSESEDIGSTSAGPVLAGADVEFASVAASASLAAVVSKSEKLADIAIPGQVDEVERQAVLASDVGLAPDEEGRFLEAADLRKFEEIDVSDEKERARLRAGPKVLGRIELPVARKPQGEARRVVQSDELVFEDDQDKSGKGRGRARKREISRSDLVDYEGRETRRKPKSKGAKASLALADREGMGEIKGPKQSKRVVKVGEFITVGDLAKQLSVKAGEVIGKLIALGVLATINQAIDRDTATIVAEEFGFTVESTEFDEDSLVQAEVEEDDALLVERPPVITVMGHVDHGKTSLLDYIRQASVAAREHGGITQHIGAYQVTSGSGKPITFIDTPGHAAFTTMRARGAEITDIVILVVAADDGVMPQTVEAINHAKAASVPIVVAINKMDKADANPDRIKSQLAELGLQPEDWGGDTMFYPVSALKGTGVEELLEGVLLLAEVRELKAAPDRRARGTVIETRQERGLGVVATVLVQTGTLRVGDIFVTGSTYGRVRSMTDCNGEKVDEAPPSCPVEISGINGAPEAGDDFVALENESDAKAMAENRADRRARDERALAAGPVSLEEFARRASEEAALELNVILKTDVHGSLEALQDALVKLSTAKVKVRVIHSAVGGVSESDIQLAKASKAVIIGFGVRGEPRALSEAEQFGIEVRFYRVIYEVLDDVKVAMVGLLPPVKTESTTGHATVRETFMIPKIGMVAGSYMTDGTARRGACVRIVRDGRVIYDGKVGSLRRFKEDVRQVQEGYECGIGIENFNDVKVGDVLEIYEMKEIAASLE